jgi:hypothetical protein
MNAHQMAGMFTQLAIHGMLESYLRQLEEIAGLDRLFGAAGRESRDAGRADVALKVEVAQHALQLRKQAGRR